MKWIINKHKANISRFETNSKEEAKRIKDLLDSKKVGYCACVTSTKHPLKNGEYEWYVIFNIYSGRCNADILRLMFEMEEST